MMGCKNADAENNHDLQSFDNYKQFTEDLHCPAFQGRKSSSRINDAFLSTVLRTFMYMYSSPRAQVEYDAQSWSRRSVSTRNAKMVEYSFPDIKTAK
jgi:hypothetical protein